jgi:hypothetical protein
VRLFLGFELGGPEARAGAAEDRREVVGTDEVRRDEQVMHERLPDATDGRSSGNESRA